MFRSISTRISYIVAIVVISATVITLLFTSTTVEDDMTDAQGRTARNTIRMGLLYLQEGRQAIERYRDHAFKDRKQAIKDAMDIFISQVDSYYSLYKAGKLTENEAKQAAYELARNTRYFNNDYFSFIQISWIPLPILTDQWKDGICPRLLIRKDMLSDLI